MSFEKFEKCGKIVGIVVWYTFSSIYRAARSEIPNLRLPVQPPTRTLFLPPGRLKIDEISIRHRFLSFLVSLNQIQSPKHKESHKKFRAENLKKKLGVPLAFFRFFGRIFFVEVLSFNGEKYFEETKYDVFRHRLLILSFYLVNKWNIKLTPYRPTSWPWTAPSPGPFKIDKLSNRPQF